MTDLFREDTATFARMGIIAEVVDGHLRMRLEPQAELLHHGLLRASVASLMIDLVAGFALEAPGSWVLTTDLSVRMRPEPAPRSVSTRCTVLRQGGRSATAVVDLVDGDDRGVATGAIGFTRVPRDEGTPDALAWSTTERITAQFNGSNALTRPLREETCIAVLDPNAGEIEMPVTATVRNGAGTLQGAMVALVAEVAAEELLSARFRIPAVVTDLDLRYLAQTGDGPVSTRCSLLGDGPDAWIQVEIFDRSKDRLTTFAYVRAASVATT